MKRIESEKKTVEQMIRLYCRLHEGNATLCPECSSLLAYALKRLTQCKFGEKKSTCRKCPIHCYKPEMRERMQQVMRFSGPRMLWHHPIAALRHLWQEWTCQTYK
ncbi:MAG: nitrous oxide-stimulated promoter family protein [Bacteroidaceae bacterium]|nr:nitrous oxide-stimulated promoter family protein [Bacteroidaceae bacterium]